MGTLSIPARNERAPILESPTSELDPEVEEALSHFNPFGLTTIFAVPSD
jgi:hypothetical protein